MDTVAGMSGMAALLKQTGSEDLKKQLWRWAPAANLPNSFHENWLQLLNDQGLQLDWVTNAHSWAAQIYKEGA
jgi:hypothetical protein